MFTLNRPTLDTALPLTIVLLSVRIALDTPHPSALASTIHTPFIHLSTPRIYPLSDNLPFIMSQPPSADFTHNSTIQPYSMVATCHPPHLILKNRSLTHVQVPYIYTHTHTSVLSTLPPTHAQPHVHPREGNMDLMFLKYDGGNSFTANHRRPDTIGRPSRPWRLVASAACPLPHTPPPTSPAHTITLSLSLGLRSQVFCSSPFSLPD